MIARTEAIEALKRKIEEVFASVAYPGDDKLVCDDSGQEWLDDPDEYRLKGAIRSKHWKEINSVVVNPTFSDSIFYLTPKAFQHYVPAYLTAALDFNDDTVFIYSVISALTPSDDGRFRSFARKLTNDQRDVIIEVLQYLYRTKAQDDDLLKRYLDAALLQE